MLKKDRSFVSSFLFLSSLLLQVIPVGAQEVELGYDNGGADFGFVAAPSTIAAVKFVCDSPTPCQILKLKFFVWGEMKPVSIKVLDSNFNPIFSHEANPYEGWFTVDVSYANIIIDGGRPFYIGWQWISEPPRPWLGVDTTPPNHGQSYLGTVGNPGSPKSGEDYMIRVAVRKIHQQVPKHEMLHAFYTITGDGVVRVFLNGSIQIFKHFTPVGYSLDILGDKLYVIRDSKHISVYTINGVFLRDITIPSPVKYFLSFVILPDERIALLDNSYDKVYFIDSFGKFITSVNILDEPDSRLQNVHGVIVNYKLILSEDGYKHILQIDLTTFQKTIFKDLSELPLSWLGAITYSNGYYYVCGPSSIYKFSESGDVTKIAEIPDYNIVGIVIVDNFAYVSVNFGGKIYKVDLESGVSEVFVSGLNHPRDLKVYPVAEIQGVLQHFDLDYRGTTPNSDGNDQTTIIASPCSNFTLFFYYKEGNTGNPYIIRVYPEWYKDRFIANSDNNEAAPESGENGGREIGGFRWDVETYTVPCTPGTYRVRVVYRGSHTPPTWDSYDKLLAEGTVIVHPERTGWITIYNTIERTVVSTTTVTFTTQHRLTTTMYNIIERTVTFTAQDIDPRTVSIAALIFSALILVVSLTILRRRKTFMKEYHHTPSNISDELLRRTKLMELERLKAEGKISEEAYRRLREEFESEG
jgi:hypothetical protein